MMGMISPVSMARPAGNVSSIYNYRMVQLQRSPRQAMTGTPVTPVRPAMPVYSEAPSRVTPAWQETVPGTVLPQAYPAEMAARMRVQYLEYPEEESFGLSGGDQLMGYEGVETEESLGAEGAQQAAKEGECQTCKERKYQDGSDDASVSFQTPTHIDADAAPAAVRGHEMEHVSHEQARAKREGRKVVSQTVTMHTDICPECGRVYVSGGTTRTVTKADNAQETMEPEEEQG